MLKANTIEYKLKVRDRFLKAMRSIISTRKEGCKNVTQFAALIGEHQQNISKMENDEGRFPTVDHLCRMCEVFDISPSWLLLGKGSMENSSDYTNELSALESRVRALEIMAVKSKK